LYHYAQGPSWLTVQAASAPPPSGGVFSGAAASPPPPPPRAAFASPGGAGSGSEGGAELDEAIQAALEAEDEAAGLRHALDAAGKVAQRAVRESAVLRLRGSGLAAATEAVLLERVGGGAGRELVESIIAAARPSLGAGARALASAWLAAVPSRAIYGGGGRVATPGCQITRSSAP
jgi:hypothetical protein